MLKFDFGTVESFNDAKTMCCEILDAIQNKTVYIAEVSSCDEHGCIRETKVVVYNNYFNLSEVINKHEYLGVSVNVYIADSDRFIGVKYKTFDGLGYRCLANYTPRYLSEEHVIVARRLFDLRATVFVYKKI